MKSKIIQIVNETRQGSETKLYFLCEDGSVWEKTKNRSACCWVEPFGENSAEEYVNLELEAKFKPILNELKLMRFVQKITWKDNCILVKGNADSILDYCKTVQTFGYLNCSPLSEYAYQEDSDLVKIRLTEF